MSRGFGMVPAWFAGQLTPYEVAVWVALTWHADKDGSCWPSHTALGESVGMSETSVKKALAGLREKGLVTWEKRRREDGGKTSNLYRIDMSGGSEGPTHRRETPIPQASDAPPIGATHLGTRTTELEPLNKTTTSPPPDGDGAELVLLNHQKVPQPNPGHLVAAWCEGYAKPVSKTALGRVKSNAKRYGGECKSIDDWRSCWGLFRAAGEAGVMDVPTYETTHGRPPVRKKHSKTAMVDGLISQFNEDEDDPVVLGPGGAVEWALNQMKDNSMKEVEG